MRPTRGRSWIPCRRIMSFGQRVRYFIYSSSTFLPPYEPTHTDNTNTIPGAGGKGGPASTIAVDQEAAKHFLSASFASAYVSKFLMVSYLGCRRNKPIWMSDDDWAALMHVKTEALPTYVKAKLEADEYMTALVAKRKTDTSAHPLQAINLRPGFLIDAPATRKVQLGRTAGRGSVTREDVAIVADQLLVSADAEGWIDLINGDVPVEVAVQKVGKEKNDAVEGEDVKGMVRRFFP